MPGHTLLNPPGLPAPISHYSNGVKVGDTIYVSGQVALDGDGRLVGPGDVVAQTRQVLDNIRRVLAAGGATLDDVVKVTVYLANVDDRPRVNEVRQAYFGANRPASTLVEVSRLALPGLLVEIEAVAVVSAPRLSGRTRRVAPRYGPVGAPGRRLDTFREGRLEWAVISPRFPYRGFIFDLDGTVYLGERLLPGARRGDRGPPRRGAPGLLPLEQADPEPGGLRGEADAPRRARPRVDEVINSSYVLARYLAREAPGARCFVIGEPPLVEELRAAGLAPVDDARVDYVVVAFDRTFDYRKLDVALQAVTRHGARLVGHQPRPDVPGRGRGDPRRRRDDRRGGGRDGATRGSGGGQALADHAPGGARPARAPGGRVRRRGRPAGDRHRDGPGGRPRDDPGPDAASRGRATRRSRAGGPTTSSARSASS